MFQVKNAGEIPVLYSNWTLDVVVINIVGSKKTAISEVGRAWGARAQQPDGFVWIMPGEVQTKEVGICYKPLLPAATELNVASAKPSIEQDEVCKPIMERDRRFLLDHDLVSPVITY